MSQNPVSCVDDIIVEPKPSKARRSASEETQALLGLSEVMAHAPDHAVQRLVQAAMKLTGGDSAGISLEDELEGQPVFRWVAVAGEFSRYLHATMPREFSPCNTVVSRGKTLVMRDLVRFFPYAADFHLPLQTALLTPYGRGGKLVGTVWIVSHDARKEFSSDDVRTVEKMTTFSTSILDVLQTRGARNKGAAGEGENQS
jgi:GAF domain-containing protein